MKRPGIAAVGLALVLASLTAHSSLAQAQPLATISLPPPGISKSLYAGCNNISLTFPDGAASQTVVQAVTPVESVESLWRHSAALNKFEGFSPAAPQASDLLTVSFLDAVWLCVAATPPGAGSPPPPPWAGDIAVTDIRADNLPQGRLYATITNYGPVVLMSVVLDLSCSAHGTQPGGTAPPVDLSTSQEVFLQLSPAETAEFGTGIDIDASLYQYEVTCSVPVEEFDPDPSNNIYSETVPTP